MRGRPSGCSVPSVRRSVACLPALIVPLLLLAGCSGSSDKAGGTSARKTTVLRLAIGTDGSEVGGFANEVRRLSGGTMRIDIIGPLANRRASFEQGVIHDVSAGKVEVGAVGARAWDSVGVNSFRALGAPLLIDSYSLQERVLTSPLLKEMLAGLSPTGLVGLGVLPGVLRRPVGVSRPLRGPSDYEGARIGLQQSMVATAALRALGATPVPVGAEGPFEGLDGIESHVTQIQGVQLAHGGGYLTTNVVLWPRPLVVFASRETLAKLSPAARAILRRALAADLSRETGFLAGYERIVAASDCSTGRPRFVAASAADIAAMRRAVQPVYADLERSAQSRRFIAQIEAMRRRLGAPVSTVPVCTKSAAAAANSTSTPVDGEYEATVRPADLPVGKRLPEQYGTWRLVLDRGRFRFSQGSDGADWNADGSVRLAGPTMTWTVADALDWANHGAPDGVPIARGDRIVFRWRRNGGALVLASDGPVPGLAARPLVRVGDAPGQRRLQNPSALNGIWAYTITARDYIAHHGGAGGAADNTGPLRLTIHGRRCRWTQRTPHGFHWANGSCRFAGDTLEFDQTMTDGGPGFPLFLHWSLFHGRLTFRTAPGTTPQDWTYHAWRRVG